MEKNGIVWQKNRIIMLRAPNVEKVIVCRAVICLKQLKILVK